MSSFSILLNIIFILSFNFNSLLSYHGNKMNLRTLRRSDSSTQINDFVPPFKEYGPNNFGDIMGTLETYTKFTGTQFSPLERIIITANGNLQRILSAYYGRPITISIKKCDLVDGSTTEFDREVDLLCDGKVVCTATGKISIFSERGMDAITNQEVGVGQLFRYFQVLPTFTLLKAGYLKNNLEMENSYDRQEYNLWREYELSCSDLRCLFVEKFVTGFLTLFDITNDDSKLLKESELSIEISDTTSNINNNNTSKISSTSDCAELP